MDRTKADEAALCRLTEALGKKQVENERLREFVGWIDSWVSNPVGSYSVAALDGIFGMTRDRIAKLSE